MPPYPELGGAAGMALARIRARVFDLSLEVRKIQATVSSNRTSRSPHVCKSGMGGRGGNGGKGDFFGRCEIDSYEPTHREKGSGAGVPKGRSSTFSSVLFVVVFLNTTKYNLTRRTPFWGCPGLAQGRRLAAGPSE